MLGHGIALAVETIFTAHQKPDHREQDRRAAAPDGRISTPLQIETAARSQALQLGPDGRDFGFEDIGCNDHIGRFGHGVSWRLKAAFSWLRLMRIPVE
jgi:hypothetical protein